MDKRTAHCNDRSSIGSQRATSGRIGISPSEALGLILRELKKSGLACYTTQRASEVMVRFTIYVEKGHGLDRVSEIAEEHVEGFVFASLLGRADQPRRPSVATMHIRRTALRLYFRTGRQLGLFQHDPTLDLYLPPRSCLAARPLTDDEVALCRSYSLHTLNDTRHPAAWALAEATGRTSEIPALRVCDLELAKARVWLHGSVRTESRWGYLSEWGLVQLERRLRTLRVGSDSDVGLIYGGSGPQESRIASSCAAISDTLIRAGLSAEADVRPVSVAAWAGAKILSETDRIEEAARRLGLRSLDGASRMIAWDWRVREQRA